MATLTMKERLEAKLKREQMLKLSFKDEMTKENFKSIGLDMDEMRAAEEMEITMWREQGLPSRGSLVPSRRGSPAYTPA
jgi:hypothetical protein